MNKFILIGVIFFLQFCHTKNENEVHVDLLPLIDNGKTYLLSNGMIDMDLTPNCGTATPATTATGTTGTTTTTTTSTKTTNTRFTVLSQFVMKTTKEILTIKFIYDTTQTQGPIDQQQGFTFTGGVFNDTVTGKQGLVKWLNQGVNVDDSNQGTQVVQFLNINVNLQGTYTPGVGTTTTPIECYTSDSINCTSTVTSTKCFTTDNRTCLSSASTASGGTPIVIKGTLNCNAKNIPVSG
ncbi:MAG: hypothetical protein HS129_00670 [Leptospiraceae bacterium]|nr:hypothetical protein [Leptospiraceae bacterium]NUM42428.1 hypothetical protein [Leptospiraceae bacterium]